MSYCGIGATVLGFADPDVDAAVKAAIDLGSMSTLNCAEDVELAELLIELHPWADMVRFGRSGGEAMAVAVRIARAATGRDKVAFCGYHGWHDWYLSANLGETTALDGHLLPGLDTAGVPRGLAGLMHPFHYNRLDEIEAIVAEHGDRLAAIVMEPVRSSEPNARIPQRHPPARRSLRRRADLRRGHLRLPHQFRRRAPRLRRRSRHRRVRQGARQRLSDGGDRRPARQRWTRRRIPSSAARCGPSASDRSRRWRLCANTATQNVSHHLMRIGKRVQDGWTEAARNADLPIHVSGISPLGHFAFEVPEAQEVRTLFTQMMLDRGIFATGRSIRCMRTPTHTSIAIWRPWPTVFARTEDGDRPERRASAAARPGRPFRIQAADLKPGYSAAPKISRTTLRSVGDVARTRDAPRAARCRRQDRPPSITIVARGHQRVVAEPGAADHAAAAIHHDAAAERRIVVREVRADRAVVIADEVIACSSRVPARCRPGAGQRRRRAARPRR